MQNIDLSEVSKTIEKRLDSLETNLAENTKKLQELETYAAGCIKRIRTSLPKLYNSDDWMQELSKTVDMLGEIEELIEKFDSVSIEKIEEVSLEELINGKK